MLRIYVQLINKAFIFLISLYIIVLSVAEGIARNERLEMRFVAVGWNREVPLVEVLLVV